MLTIKFLSHLYASEYFFENCTTIQQIIYSIDEKYANFRPTHKRNRSLALVDRNVTRDKDGNTVVPKNFDEKVNGENHFELLQSSSASPQRRREEDRRRERERDWGNGMSGNICFAFA